LGAIVIVDAFWGDAGKGKFSAYFSAQLNAALCVRAGVGPNAGHSIYRSGERTSRRLLPLGFVNPRTKLMIGAGVAITPSILLDEILCTETTSRTFVDYRCPVIEDHHVRAEQEDPVMIAIDSTKTGAGAARADYIMRRGRRAKDVAALEPYLLDVAEACNRSAKDDVVIIEGSQATYLSLYLSDRYPYTSSDNCTTAAFVDDVGLNWQLIDRVVLLVKCLPTSVGNGPLPHEMSQDDIKRRGLEEFGVNTGRPRRRSARIDDELLRYSVMLNGPTEIALTYCDQFDTGMTGCTMRDAMTDKMRRLIADVERVAGVPVTYLDTGKEFANILALSGSGNGQKAATTV
jgi:adenylosuccinate synthase